MNVRSTPLHRAIQGAGIYIHDSKPSDGVLDFINFIFNKFVNGSNYKASSEKMIGEL
jgi:hypothetical protein